MFRKTSNPYKFKYLVTGITGPGIEQVYLPEQPPDEEIHFREEDKFVRPEMPAQLKKWAKEYHLARQEDETYIHAHQEEINEWEAREDDRCENGFWFWNKGQATYINGFYYWILTCWNPYFGKPTYRETDKEICYWIQFWEEDPDSYGGCLNTVRRYGKSSLMGAWIVYRTTRHFNHMAGMQGETDKKIAAFYKKFVLRPFYKLPPYVQPTYNLDTKQASKIEFDIPAQRSKKRTQFDTEDLEVLESMIDYRASGEGEYDGEILNSYVMEEPGKCWAKNTPILMYDGSIKMCQDIKKNDLLMGDDSTPRVVTELVRGTDKMYRIVPTSNRKAKSWVVTENHILCCKISGGTRFPGYKKGDIVELSVKTYLKLTEHQKAHLNCYRVAVEYKESQHKLDPYFLGLWLGDGSHEGSSICTEDPEIKDYLYEFVKENNWSIRAIADKKNKNNKFQVFYISGGLRGMLHSEGFYKNKHIPESYMIDSRQNRLKLLAGLIDTDGHREDRKNRPNQRSYEITQKRKDLAFQIQRLALSLGFYASCNAKTATMRRKDGTVYRNTVHRVMIYGLNMDEIPCRVQRKKMPTGFTTYNTKDPQVYGFRIQFDKVDKFYGFNLTGNKRHLLSDFTVAHNCQKISLYDEDGEGRWDIVKPCFLQGGEEICGKAFLGTTVENLKVVDKGGRAYQQLFYDSDYNVRQEDGRTMSGLYTAFLRARYSLKTHIDEWGFPLADKAWEMLQKTRRSYAKRPSKLAGWIRKYPDTIQEIFYVNPDKCEFNSMNIQTRLEEIATSTTAPTERIEFFWENGKRDTKVKWRPSPNGWSQVAKGIGFKDMPNNLIQQRGVNSDGVPLFYPMNDKIILGVDPIEHGVVTQPGRASKPVGVVKLKYDESIDGPYPNEEELEERYRQRFPYKTNRKILLYDHRPTDPNKFYEYMIMICVYFGCAMSVESQKAAIISYFHHRGYGAFVLPKFRPDHIKPDREKIDGTPSSQPLIQHYTSKIAHQKEYFCHLEPFKEILEDNLVFDPGDTRVHDYTVAEGFAELGCETKSPILKAQLRDIHDFLPGFNSRGRLVK